MVDDEFLKRRIYSAKIRRKRLRCVEILRLGRSLTLREKIRRLKSALRFFVINYGLKSVA